MMFLFMPLALEFRLIQLLYLCRKRLFKNFAHTLVVQANTCPWYSIFLIVAGPLLKSMLMAWYLCCKQSSFHTTGLTAARRWFDIRWLFHVIKSLILSVIFLVWSSCIISYLLPDYSMLNKWVYGRYFRIDVNILATFARVSIVLYNSILKQGRTSCNSSICLLWWMKT